MKTIDKKTPFNKALAALRAEEDRQVLVKEGPDVPTGFVASDAQTLADAYRKLGWHVDEFALTRPETVLVGISEPDAEGEEPVAPVEMPKDPAEEALKQIAPEAPAHEEGKGEEPDPGSQPGAPAEEPAKSLSEMAAGQE